MSYYSMFHKTKSLCFIVGIKCENHTASIFLLKELFNINNKEILYAKEERIDKQYYTDFKVKENEVKNLIQQSEEFISKLDLFIDSLTEDKRNQFLEQFKEIIS